MNIVINGSHSHSVELKKDQDIRVTLSNIYDLIKNNPGNAQHKFTYRATNFMIDQHIMYVQLSPLDGNGNLQVYDTLKLCKLHSKANVISIWLNFIDLFKASI